MVVVFLLAFEGRIAHDGISRLKSSVIADIAGSSTAALYTLSPAIELNAASAYRLRVCNEMTYKGQ